MNLYGPKLSSSTKVYITCNTRFNQNTFNTYRDEIYRRKDSDFAILFTCKSFVQRTSDSSFKHKYLNDFCNADVACFIRSANRRSLNIILRVSTYHFKFACIEQQTQGPPRHSHCKEDISVHCFLIRIELESSFQG